MVQADRRILQIAPRMNAWLLLVLLIPTDGSPDRNLLKGQHLIATISHLIPSSRIERNSSGHVIGYSGEIFHQFHWLSQRLHFTYTLHPAPENAPGFIVNGSWRGMIGELVRKEVNISLGPFAHTLERNRVIDFAGYLGSTDARLLVKYPRPEISYYAVLEPFNYITWICWLVSLVAVCFAAAVLVHFRYRSLSAEARYKSLSDLIMLIFGMITCQGSYYRSGHRAIGILAVVWALAAFVYVNVYSGVLTSYLSAKYKAPEVNSLEQLATSTTYKVVTQKGTYLENEMMTSNLPYMKLLAAKWQKCSECRPTMAEEIMAHVLEGDSAGFIVTLTANYLIANDFKATGKCRLTTANFKYGNQHMSFGLPKGTPFLEEINRASALAHQLGLLAKWTNFQVYPSQCLLKYGTNGMAIENSNFPLRIEQLRAAFSVLGIGYVAAIFVFIRERLSHP